jgi:hypothetical protein
LHADDSGAVAGVPDGVVDWLDYDFWKANFGNVLSGQGAASFDQGGSSLAVSQRRAGANEADSAAEFAEAGSAFAVSIGQDRRAVSPRLATLGRAILGNAEDEKFAGLVAWPAARSEPSRWDHGDEGCTVQQIQGPPKSSHVLDDVFASLCNEFRLL